AVRDARRGLRGGASPRVRSSPRPDAGARFPLSPSQRQALQHVLPRASEPSGSGSSRKRGIQGAPPDGHWRPGLESGRRGTGPPGNGKAAAEQGGVASLWVEAAVAAGEPPILLVSSTNNQAVTNVIESFSRGGLDEESGGSLLAGRWLPGLGGYGLYCVSA